MDFEIDTSIALAVMILWLMLVVPTWVDFLNMGLLPLILRIAITIIGLPLCYIIASIIKNKG